MIDHVYQLTALAASCKVRGGGSVSERVLFAGRRRLGTSVVCRKKRCPRLCCAVWKSANHATFGLAHSVRRRCRQRGGGAILGSDGFQDHVWGEGVSPTATLKRL